MARTVTYYRAEGIGNIYYAYGYHIHDGDSVEVSDDESGRIEFAFQEHIGSIFQLGSLSSSGGHVLPMSSTLRPH